MVQSRRLRCCSRLQSRCVLLWAFDPMVQEVVPDPSLVLASLLLRDSWIALRRKVGRLGLLHLLRLDAFAWLASEVGALVRLPTL